MLKDRAKVVLLEAAVSETKRRLDEFSLSLDTLLLDVKNEDHVSALFFEQHVQKVEAFFRMDHTEDGYLCRIVPISLLAAISLVKEKK